MDRTHETEGNIRQGSPIPISALLFLKRSIKEIDGHESAIDSKQVTLETGRAEASKHTRQGAGNRPKIEPQEKAKTNNRNRPMNRTTTTQQLLIDTSAKNGYQ